MTVSDIKTTAGRLLEQLIAIFTSPVSNFSALSLLSAFAVSALFLCVRRGRGRPIRPAALVRALLPKRWLKSPSVHADLGLMLFNTFVAGALLGWAILSADFVNTAAGGLFDSVFGTTPAFEVSRSALYAILTVAIYLGYELGYFVDHWLKHRIPFLWQFHRVHHSAEELTPFTNARMHPVDSVIFANITGPCVGLAGSLASHVFAAPGAPIPVGGVNAIMIAALFLILHLHHSHVWIPFTGTLGKLVLSPAHHQLHHSTDPRHFNRNLGATLAVFDHLAGTLLVPTKKRERLTFGAGPYGYDPHGVTGTLVMPFVEAAAELRPQPTVTETATSA